MKIYCNLYEIDGERLWKVGNDEIGHNYYRSATEALEITKYLQAQADAGRMPDFAMVMHFPY